MLRRPGTRDLLTDNAAQSLTHGLERFTVIDSRCAEAARLTSPVRIERPLFGAVIEDLAAVVIPTRLRDALALIEFACWITS